MRGKRNSSERRTNLKMTNMTKMKSKRLLSFLLIVAIFATCLVYLPDLSGLIVLPAFAAEEAPTGTPIESVEDLAKMSSNNSYYLTDNITLDDSWTPLNLDNVTLDGNGKTITVDTKAVFGKATNLTAKRIKFAGDVKTADTMFYVAPLANGLVGNCTITNVESAVNYELKDISTAYTASDGIKYDGYDSDGTLKSSNENAVGGIAAYVVYNGANEVTFKDCSYTGNMTVTAHGGFYFVGGVVGYVRGSGSSGAKLTFDNVTLNTKYTTNVATGYDQKVTAYGGIAGTVAAGSLQTSFVNCTATIETNLENGENTSYTQIQHYGGYVGNTWGGGSSMSFTGCSVSMEYKGSKDGYDVHWGGFLSKTDNGGVSFTNCTTTGTVSLVESNWNDDDRKRHSAGGFISEFHNSPVAEFISCTNGISFSVANNMETYIGGFTGWIYGTSKTLKFDNCTNNGSISVGGIMGHSNDNTKGGKMGGIVGGALTLAGSDDSSQPTIYINNCHNKGNLKAGVANDEIGGIVGYMCSGVKGDVVISNCTNSGSITVTTANAGSGGIIGLSERVVGNITVSNCKNTGSISMSDKGYSTGGIVSNITGGAEDGSNSVVRKYDLSITDCVNEGNISAPNTLENDAGGIAGSLLNFNKAYITNCTNSGSFDVGIMTAKIELAGIVGAVEHMNDGVMNGCKNYGNLQVAWLGSTNYCFLGGIMGSMWSPSTASTQAILNFKIVNCENHGSLTVGQGSVGSGNNCGIGGILGETYNEKDTITATDTQNKQYIWSCINLGEILISGEPWKDKNPSGTTDFGRCAAVHIGGIVGALKYTSFMDIRHCINFAKIDAGTDFHGWDDLGGIAGGIMTIGDTDNISWSGVSYSDFYFIDCHNKGALNGAHTGGILGATWQIYDDACEITIKGCTNDGNISGHTGSYKGGIVGITEAAVERGKTMHTLGGDFYISDCVNNGNITGAVVAGIIPWRRDFGYVSDTYGYVYNCGKTYIDNCSNTGELKSLATVEGGEYVGGSTTTVDILVITSGIMWHVAGDVKITNCSNTGALSGGSSQAAICGTTSNPSPADAKKEFTIEDNYYETEYGTVNTSFGTLDGDTATAASKAAEDEKLAYGYGYYSNGYSYTDGAGNTVKAEDSGASYIITSPGEAHYLSAMEAPNTDKYLVNSLNNLPANATVPTLNGGSLNGTMYWSYGEESDTAGIYINGSAHAIGGITNGGVVNKVNFDGNSSSAPIGEINNGTVQNVVSTVTVSGSGSLAGIALSATNATFKNVSFSGSITTSNGINGNVGGFVAELGAGCTFEGCSNAGSSITSTGTGSSAAHYGVGGWFGQIVGNVSLTGLTNRCIINVEDEGVIAASASDTVYAPCVGGIVGHLKVVQGADSFSITSCTNNAAISGYCAGGIVGGACTDTRLQDKNAERNNATIVISNCTNNSAITGTAAAGGIIADTASIVGYKLTHNQTQKGGVLMADTTISNCINAGRVYTTERTEFTLGGATSVMIFTGGIVGVTDSAQISGCTNRGEVDGYKRTGGILGSRHNNLEKLVSVTNCINAGNVKSGDFAGGIIGYIETSRVDITSCVNAGEVYSYAEYLEIPSEYSAGGIVGAVSGDYYTYAQTVEMGIYIDIDKCVNAGVVQLYSGAAREYDSYSSAGGIVGYTTQGLSVTNCAHHGELYTNVGGKGKNPQSYSTHPILNCIEMAGKESEGVLVAPEGDTTTKGYFNVNNPDRLKDWGMYEISGNVFLEGSISREGFEQPEYYHFSTCVEEWELEESIALADVRFYSTEITEGLVALAGVVKENQNGYTAEQKQAITDAVAVANGLVAQNPASQTDMVEADRALRQAIYGYDDGGTAYEITIPASVVVGRDVEISIKHGSTYFSSITVDMASEGGFKLTDVKGNTIDYTLTGAGEKEGEAYTHTYRRQNTVDFENGAYSYTVRATVVANASAPAGTYRDRISFVVSYDDGKPNAPYIS